MRGERTRTRRRLAAGAGLVAVAVMLDGAVTARQAEGDEERTRVADATQALREMVRADDAKGIPAELLERARAIAVVPHVVRGAFIVGGRWGKGVVTTRDDSGEWGPASFIDLSGASVGFQIGADATDLLMVFIEESGLEALLEDKVQLGGNVSAAAGPLGRSLEVGTNATLDSAIYAYSRSKGAFAGAALDGTVITIDDSANEVAFGRPIDGRSALSDSVETPAVFAPFVGMVSHVTPDAAR